MRRHQWRTIAIGAMVLVVVDMFAWLLLILWHLMPLLLAAGLGFTTWRLLRRRARSSLPPSRTIRGQVLDSERCGHDHRA